MAFEDHISGVIREFLLNRNFIPCRPKSPQQRPYASPSDSTASPFQRFEGGDQISTRGWVPIRVERFPYCAPRELGQVTSKEDVIIIFT